MDYIVHGITKSRTLLSDFHFHFQAYLAQDSVQNKLDIQAFHSGSNVKESTCNAGHPGSISGLGRSAGEGIGYPLQYYWASRAAQLIKNPPTMWETWIRFLGWEDLLEKEMCTHSSILAWRTLWTCKESMGVSKSWTCLNDFHSLTEFLLPTFCLCILS